MVPTGSEDTPFMLSEISSDFQELTLQGQITYRISEPAKAAKMLNYAINSLQLTHIPDDPQKLPERLINLALVVIKGTVQHMSLKEAIVSADDIASKAGRTLAAHEMVKTPGVEILGLSVAAIKPTPETAKALEAETREAILKESDQAIFLRRNYAVEQERLRISEIKHDEICRSHISLRGGRGDLRLRTGQQQTAENKDSENAQIWQHRAKHPCGSRLMKRQQNTMAGNFPCRKLTAA
jgi:hypothetical protein